MLVYCGVNVGVVRVAVISLCWALFKIIQYSGLIWSTIELKSVSGLCSVPMVV